MTKHTEEEIEVAAERFKKWADDVDPKTLEWEDTSDLRDVAQAADAVGAAERRLLETVELARANGRSWNRIAVALGVSRQAARQRFADKVPAA
jgi:hypothetical protein